MGDVIPFKRPKPTDPHKGKIFCQNGLHKWVIVPEKPFDVKQGKLVTVHRCARCGLTKVQAK